MARITLSPWRACFCCFSAGLRAFSLPLSLSVVNVNGNEGSAVWGQVSDARRARRMQCWVLGLQTCSPLPRCLGPVPLGLLKWPMPLLSLRWAPGVGPSDNKGKQTLWRAAVWQARLQLPRGRPRVTFWWRRERSWVSVTHQSPAPLSHLVTQLLDMGRTQS